MSSYPWHTPLGTSTLFAATGEEPEKDGPILKSDTELAGEELESQLDLDRLKYSEFVIASGGEEKYNSAQRAIIKFIDDLNFVTHGSTSNFALEDSLEEFSFRDHLTASQEPVEYLEDIAEEIEEELGLTAEYFCPPVHLGNRSYDPEFRRIDGLEGLLDEIDGRVIPLLAEFEEEDEEPVALVGYFKEGGYFGAKSRDYLELEMQERIAERVQEHYENFLQVSET